MVQYTDNSDNCQNIVFIIFIILYLKVRSQKIYRSFCQALTVIIKFSIILKNRMQVVNIKLGYTYIDYHYLCLLSRAFVF